MVCEASELKLYTGLTIASASTLSGSVLRTFRDGEGFPTDLHRALGTSVASVQLSAAPLYKRKMGRRGRRYFGPGGDRDGEVVGTEAFAYRPLGSG